MIRAGLPAIITPGGTDLVTTDPAPMITSSETTIPGINTQFTPIKQRDPIVIGLYIAVFSSRQEA
jgi:hypothetical protein